jgi:hypothetical protein
MGADADVTAEVISAAGTAVTGVAVVTAGGVAGAVTPGPVQPVATSIQQTRPARRIARVFLIVRSLKMSFPAGKYSCWNRSVPAREWFPIPVAFTADQMTCPDAWQNRDVMYK